MQRSFGNADFLRTLEGTEAWSAYERIVGAFEDAWRTNPPPQVEAYLCGEGAIRKALLVELVHTDLEFRLKSGEAVDAQRYLESYPELASDRETLEDLVSTAADLQRRLTRKTAAGAPVTARSPAQVSPWPQVEGYTILQVAGSGGMGIVYKAVEENLGRTVALKFLPADFAGDPDRLGRFRKEARAASALNHPHICTVHALGEHEGHPFIVLEYIEGETLQAQIARRPAVDDVVRWIVQAARALAAAHGAGVVHRDVKPENLMIRPDGYLKVVDFGLAHRPPALLPSGSDTLRLTQPHVFFGTVPYMSPEQTRGLPAESASDVFALGIVFYQLLTGVHPFQADSPLLTLAEIAASEPVAASQRNPEIPPAIDPILEGMLHKDPRLRATAAEVDAALTAMRRRTAAASPPAAERPIIRREPELAALNHALAEAMAGRGSMICLSGEPGIGKTTLVSDFLSALASSEDPPLVTHGQCSERLADSGVYVPVLEAIECLLRAPQGARTARLMEAVAPSWLSQVGSTTSGSPIAVPAAKAMSQQAMLREFCNLVEQVTRHQPLVLFLDDVHWADLSTIDLLSHLGRQCGQLRLLVVLTFRPTELLLSRRTLHQVLLELQGHGVSRELPLGFLQPGDVDRYLSIAFPGHALPAELAGEVFRRTEGSPLFMVDLLNYLVSRGVLAQVDGTWQLVQELPNLREDLPVSVRSMIQRKLDRLDAAQRRVLSAASVQGNAFDSAAVAGALECDPLEVEDVLQHLDRIHRLVRFESEEIFPDRTVTARYAFVHALYQQALYHDLSPGRRTVYSGAMARRLERHYGQRRSLVAAPLAYLFEAGGEQLRAAEYLYLAARHAAKVFAHHEAITLARRGLGLLVDEAASPERLTVELNLQTLLGLQLQVTQGYGAVAAKHAYTRSLALCADGRHAQQRFPVVWGLWLCNKVASNLPRAQTLADELFTLAAELHDPNLALQAHQALGMTAFCRGQLADSLRNVEQAVTLYDPARHGEHASSFGQDPGVMCRAFGSIVLWLMGFPVAARQQSEATLAASSSMSPTTQAVAWHFAGMLCQLMREPAQVRRHAEQSVEISQEHGLSFWRAGGEILVGWATAMQGSRAEGIARLRTGLAKWRATGSVTYETYYLGLLAELLLADGQLAAAAGALDEAHLLARRTDEKFFIAELHRLQAEAELQRDPQSTMIASELRRALDIAEAQEARSLVLRTLTSQARAACFPAARSALLDVLARFREEGDNRDVQDALRVLETAAG